MKIVSQENRVGECNICKNTIRDMLLVKGQDRHYFYACLDCFGKGSSRKLPLNYSIDSVDEEKLAREKALNILLELAEEDERVFNDRRLSVVKSFEEEIVEGSISKRLESYLNFNDNNLTEVLKVRNYALKAIGKEYNSKCNELVQLYTKSRIEKWTSDERNRLKILMSDKVIQNLDSDNEEVWLSIEFMEKEVLKESSIKKYDNLEDIKRILEFYREKDYLTESQLKRLKGFYNEMNRRKNKLIR